MIQFKDPEFNPHVEKTIDVSEGQWQKGTPSGWEGVRGDFIGEIAYITAGKASRRLVQWDGGSWKYPDLINITPDEASNADQDTNKDKGPDDGEATMADSSEGLREKEKTTKNFSGDQSEVGELSPSDLVGDWLSAFEAKHFGEFDSGIIILDVQAIEDEPSCDATGTSDRPVQSTTVSEDAGGTGESFKQWLNRVIDEAEARAKANG